MKIQYKVNNRVYNLDIWQMLMNEIDVKWNTVKLMVSMKTQGYDVRIEELGYLVFEKKNASGQILDRKRFHKSALNG